MPDTWATSCRPSANEGQTKTSAPPETVIRVDANRRSFAPTRGFRGVRLRSTTRAPSTPPRGPNLTNGEVQGRKHTEQELRLRRNKEEAWELFQKQPEEFEKKFGEKMRSKDEQEKDLKSWTNELEKAAQEEERRLEAFEKKRMGGEDLQSRSRQVWDRIFQPIPKLVPQAAGRRMNEKLLLRELRRQGGRRT